MCDVNRREFLAGGLTWLGAAADKNLPVRVAGGIGSVAAEADRVSPDVFFHEGSLSDTADAVCNNGWIIFEDYVLVIDANFPAGAREIIRKIRSGTEKPIRFAFDTHHHGDHAYGNKVFLDNGAVPVAHTGVVDEMKRLETGYYQNKPGSWESAAKGREDVRNSKLKPPSVLFPRELFFDDGRHRVELLHLGVAHTHGDAVAWLPNERILFTGDACVNGPYNYVGDGDVALWIKTLDAARKLGAKTVCPGHGPRTDGTVLDDQQLFFKTLREQAGKLLIRKSPEEARAMVEAIRGTLKATPQIARFVGDPKGTWDPFPSQVGKVYEEMTGRKLAATLRDSQLAQRAHAGSHGQA